MKIEYDDDKNQRNIQERQLPFNRAAELDWSTAVIMEDTRYQYPEKRFVATGYLGKREVKLYEH